MGELPRAIGRTWYLGTSIEAGNAFSGDSAFYLFLGRPADRN